MGPSGAGKSTLLHVLATIDQPTSGDVVIDGMDVLKMDEEQLSAFRREKLGFIFQDYNLLDTLTVKENILLPLALAKVNVKELEFRVGRLRTNSASLRIWTNTRIRFPEGKTADCGITRHDFRPQPAAGR